MSNRSHSAEYLPNAPLREAIVSLKWALPNTPQGARYDTGLDLAVGHLHQLISKEYPTFRRITTPLGLGPFQSNYNPIFRFAHESGYPLIQLGSGLMSFNESGKQYDWEHFSQALQKAVKNLGEAYPSDYLELVELRFLLINRLEVKHFEAYLRKHHGYTEEKLKTSQFFSEYLGLKVSTTYEIQAPNEKLRLLSQDILRTYELPNNLGRVTVRHRDESEEGGDQIAYWEIDATTMAHDLSLKLGQVGDWVSDVHTQTRSIFTNMSKHSHLRAYFELSSQSEKP